MNDEHREHVYQGPRYKKPLLDKPPLLPIKKPLLHHPIEVSHQKKQPLLGATPERILIKAWSGTKRVYGPEEPINTNTSPTYPPPIKRQALLPTPGEWGCVSSNVDNEQTQVVSSGLLPRPYRQVTTNQSGLLPPPTSCSSPRNIYTPPPAAPPSVENKQTLRSASLTPTAALSPSGLLPLPVSRHNEAARNMEARSNSFKKAPLLQTPSEVGLYSNSKKPLLPLVPSSIPGMPQEKTNKPPLLKVPPATQPNHLKHSPSSIPTNGTVTGPNNNQRHAREPLIPTPPPTLTSRFEAPSNAFKKSSSSGAYNHQSSNNSASIKRPLLPTPTLLC